jgi:putative endonuclease
VATTYNAPAGYCCEPAAAAAAASKEEDVVTTGIPKRTDAQVAGEAAEARALTLLRDHGLVLVQRNYRVARGRHARGGEIDLILRDRDGTLVFVEVRQRGSAGYGGAAASISASKRARLVYVAQRFLLSLGGRVPPCRFDVVAIDGSRIEWLRGAFDAGG